MEIQIQMWWVKPSKAKLADVMENGIAMEGCFYTID